MEPSRGVGPQVVRLAGEPDAVEVDIVELLGKLEAHAEESGRLRAKIAELEEAARKERESRRRVTERLRTERRAAEAVRERALRAEALTAAHAGEIERLSQALALAERHAEVMADQLAVASQPVTLDGPPLWQRVLRRPPRA